MPAPTAPQPPEPAGLILRPFRAVHPQATLPERLGARLCPPYDVIGADLRRRLAAQDSHNAVRLVLPDGEGDARYPAAARLLADWRAEGALVADREPGLYVYEQATADGHVQRGLVGALALARPEAGIVLPHEDTMPGTVADRLALLAATDADLEPILLLYEGGGPASSVVAAAHDQPAELEAATPDGVRHRVWAVTDAGTVDAVAADLRGRRAVIADGHHRYATYLRYQEQRWAAGAGPGPWDEGLTLLVDGTTFGPRVEAIHRVIPDLAPEEAARRAAGVCRVTPLTGPLEAALCELSVAGKSGPAFLLAGGAGGTRSEPAPGGPALWLLTAPDRGQLAAAVPANRSAAWRALDVTVAHYLLIRRAWGLADDERVVGFEHSVADAVAAAASTRGTAVLMNATPAQAVAAVAAAGERMPRKSTLFTPKPATGLLLRTLDLG
jgi:uncharacterized protein (DUF1015 family)